MNAAKTITGLLLLSLTSIAQDKVPPTGSDGALKNELLECIQESLRLYQYDFNVTVASRQLARLIERELKKAAPVSVSVDELHLRYKNYKGHLKATLGNLPPQFAGIAETKANELLQKAKINRLWNTVTTSFLTEAQEAVTTEATFKVLKETPRTLDIRVDGLDRPYKLALQYRNYTFI